jgi:DNA-binding IclR family transcriptional regulator
VIIAQRVVRWRLFVSFIFGCSPPCHGALDRPLAPTLDTITDPDRIRAVVNEVRERGYSKNIGGLSLGISSLGAPIVGPSGAVAALSVSGPSSRITEDRFDELGTQVRDAAARISRALRGER